MSDYDTILKEKKVYEDYTPTHTIFKKFMRFGFFLVFVVIIISYIVYYNTFLSGETILLNDVLKLMDNYSVVFDGFDNNYVFSSNYMLDGEVSLDNTKYKYTFIKDNNKIKRKLVNGSKDISFYYDGKSNYIKLSNLDKYILVDNEFLSFDNYKDDYEKASDNMFNYFKYLLFDENIMDIYNRLYTIDNSNVVVSDIRNNFLELVSDGKYSKKFYFYNGRPVVKIDLSLNSKDLNKILSNGDNNLIVKDDYNVIITTRNDAIMNDIKNVKIIINNKTDNTRVVIYYDGKDLHYTDKEGMEYRYDLVNDDKLSLKIYKGDTLYSALEGSKEDNKYVYNYQYIDKLERYTLEIAYDGDRYNYKFISNINNQIKNIVISGEYRDDGAVDEDVMDSFVYRDIADSSRDIINGSLIKYLN